jgi:hypothetical protein
VFFGHNDPEQAFYHQNCRESPVFVNVWAGLPLFILLGGLKKSLLGGWQQLEKSSLRGKDTKIFCICVTRR